MKIYLLLFFLLLPAAANAGDMTPEESLLMPGELPAMPAEASMIPAEPEISPARNHVVTSLKKCLDQLDAADVAEIRSSYGKPYQECQQRLNEKEAKAKTAAVDDAAESKVPETPRNFVRVRQPPKEPPQEPPSEREKSGKKD